LDYIILPTGLPVSNINVPEMTYYCVWWDIKQTTRSNIQACWPKHLCLV